MSTRALIVFLIASSVAAPVLAQNAGSAPPAQATTAATTDTHPATGAPAPLVVYFDMGSSAIRNEDAAVLDHASRAYNEGRPIVMVLTGSADRTGDAEANLELSQRRASAVLRGLLARGIPADRFEVLAKGETELPVPTDPGVAERQNRRVEITWR